jgi:hypothetical protein
LGKALLDQAEHLALKVSDCLIKVINNFHPCMSDRLACRLSQDCVPPVKFRVCRHNSVAQRRHLFFPQGRNFLGFGCSLCALLSRAGELSLAPLGAFPPALQTIRVRQAASVPDQSIILGGHGTIAFRNIR